MTAVFPGWTAWQPITGLPPLPALSVAELLDGGQSFRWYRQPDDCWLGQWERLLVRVGHTAEGCLQWSTPRDLAERAAVQVPRYFGTEIDFAALISALPWRSDPHLAQALSTFPGLRLLRQPMGECLLGFICSATKQIVQIKQMLALLAARHGPAVAELPAGAIFPGATSTAGGACRMHGLPDWTQLANVSEDSLRECLLGFRARHVHAAARFLAERPGWLEVTEAMPYAEAHTRLVAVPGVGAKVADCVLLFGAGRREAFPVDTWILKTLASRYHLEGWKPEQVARFGRVHFGADAGLAQQFLFAYERAARRPSMAPGGSGPTIKSNAG